MTERSAGRPTGAARIIALGASVAAGIGIIGAMATGAAADQQPAPSPTATRVLVIQQPAPTTTPVVGARTTDAPIDAVAPIESTPPMLPPAPPPAPPPPPVAVVIESVAPEPVTVTEGS